MICSYRFFLRTLLLIMVLSVLKVNVWLDRHTTYYPLIVGQNFLFRITRLNWQYGFFTSKRSDYQFIKSDICLSDELAPSQNLCIARDAGLDTLVHPINGIRVNTAIQQIVRDSLYLEAGSRAIALFLFQHHPRYRNLDFSIQAHNKRIVTQANHYILLSKTDTLFNRRISY